MATVAENIATIKTQAAALDTLITSFRAAHAIIAAAETEIAKAAPGQPHDAISGRRRLAYYAHGLMVAPDITGRPSVADLADSAWAGVE